MTDVNQEMDSNITELIRIKTGYVDEQLHWFQKHKTLPRICFRVAGIVTIVFSLSIPFLAAAGGTFQTVGVPVFALVIAVLAALNSFFAWQATWEKRINGELTLKGLIAGWEVKMTDANHNSDSQRGYQKALDATEELVDAAHALITTGTNAFFSNIKYPDISGDKQNTPDQNTPLSNTRV